MKTLTALLLFCFLIIAIFALFWGLKQWGRIYLKQVREYEADYKLIKKMIDKEPVTKNNFERIDLRLSNLRRLPYKNHEKTEILSNEFRSRYDKIRLQKHLKI